MAKRNNDYDSVFKSLKVRDTRLFIPVINDIFGKNYPADAKLQLRNEDGQLVEIRELGDAKILEKISDMILYVDGDGYVIECQSYDDESMAIRIAEYTLIEGRKNAVYEPGLIRLRLPAAAVIYVKAGKNIPDSTRIIYELPDGKSFVYEIKNIILEDITKEEIIEKKLYPYIPYYIVRYRHVLEREGNITSAVKDLEYLRDGLAAAYSNGDISSNELLELSSYVNTIITHITNGNKVERKVTEIMGNGILLESPVDKIKQEVWTEANKRIAAKDREISVRDALLTAKDREYETRLSAKDKEYDILMKWAMDHGYKPEG